MKAKLSFEIAKGLNMQAEHNSTPQTVKPQAAKHTPGPWQAVHEGHRLSVWAEGYGFIHTHEVPHVNTGATETANANARLIAAAPELLEALEEVRELIEGYVDVKDGDYGKPVANKAMQATQLIDEAIAKAEGRP